MSKSIKKSDPRTIERYVYFTCVDTSSLGTRLQASDMSTFVVYLTKNGATPVAATNAPTEVDAVHMKGRFRLLLTTAECDTPGVLGIDVKNSGGTKTMEPRELEIEIKYAHFATVASGTITAVTCDRTETTTDYFKDNLLKAVTGANAGQSKKIGSYSGNGTTATIGLASGLAFASVFANGDFVEIISE